MDGERSEDMRRGMCSRLTPDQWSAVKACIDDVRTYPARAVVSRRGEPLDRSLLLVEGLVARHVPGLDRDVREMVALEVAGDFVDLHCLPIGTLDHDVTAMTGATLAFLPHDRLRRLVAERPDVGMALWALTVADAAIHRYWAFRVGALRATGRVANFLCEMHVRLRRAGLGDAGGFELPLTQADLGEACGLSAVHVNRVVRELREAGCCAMKDGRVTILDLGLLRGAGRFDPYFLDVGWSDPR